MKLLLLEDQAADRNVLLADKTYTYEAFREAMARIIRQVGRPYRTVELPPGRRRVPVAENEILYVEVYGKETMVHTRQENLRVRLAVTTIGAVLLYATLYMSGRKAAFSVFWSSWWYSQRCNRRRSCARQKRASSSKPSGNGLGSCWPRRGC